MGKRARRRDRGSRTPAQRVLVLCEGRTEQWYLNGCKVRGAGIDARIKTASAQGEALVLAAQAENENNNSYDSTWLVFDRDNQTDSELNRAKEVASRAGFNVALSSECFEVWLLLHFVQLSPNDPRTTNYRINQLQTEIRNITGLKQYIYNKTDDTFAQFYETRIDDAIANATALSNSFGQGGGEIAPFTTVGPLVGLLRGLT